MLLPLNRTRRRKLGFVKKMNNDRKSPVASVMKVDTESVICVDESNTLLEKHSWRSPWLAIWSGGASTCSCSSGAAAPPGWGVACGSFHTYSTRPGSDPSQFFSNLQYLLNYKRDCTSSSKINPVTSRSGFIKVQSFVYGAKLPIFNSILLTNHFVSEKIRPAVEYT